MDKNNNLTAFDAAEYDEKIKKTLPYYDEFFAQIISVVKTFSDTPADWLDVGCGTGKMYAKAVGNIPINRFVFCDCSAEMLKIAESRFCGSFGSGREFLLKDMREITFEDEFDIVTSVQAMHYLKLEQRYGAVKKCFNALKPNGIFINFENFSPDSKAGEKLALERWREYQLANGRSSADVDEHLCRYKREYFPITVREQLEIMKNAGFSAAEVLWLSYMQAGFIGVKL